MGCTGSEAQLNDCKRYSNQYSSSYYGWYGYRCGHYQDIGVICPHGCLPNYEWDLSRGRCERIPDLISPAVEIFCENKCPSGKYGNVSGSTSESVACPNDCPTGSYGTAIGSVTIFEACPNLCTLEKYGTKFRKSY